MVSELTNPGFEFTPARFRAQQLKLHKRKLQSLARSRSMVEEPSGPKAAGSTAAPSVSGVASILSRYETFTADLRSEAIIVRAAIKKLSGFV